MGRKEQIGCGYCIRIDQTMPCEFYDKNREAYRYPGGTRDMALKCGMFEHFEEGRERIKRELSINRKNN